MDVTIGGEQQSLGEFSAYKALKALEILSDVESAWRAVLTEAASFRRQYGEENYVELSRVDARRQFRPRVLEQTIRRELEDGRIELIDEPVLNEETGEPLLSPDPLGHLTDADWEASGQKLRIPEQPNETLQVAAMVPLAFKHGRDATLSLMALVLAKNSELEEWDREGGDVVDAKLRDRAETLKHRADLDELVDLATAVLEMCREQVAGPFERLTAQARTIFSKPESETPETQTPPPMTVVEGTATDNSTASSPESSGSSPDGSGGPPTSSSTEPASDSSPSFASA